MTTKHADEQLTDTIGRAAGSTTSVCWCGATHAKTAATLPSSSQIARLLRSPSIEPRDGTRFLVERLWPRGMKKDSLRIDGWLKDVAPSAALRRWFGHDPAKWDAFRRRYAAELDQTPEAWQPMLEAAQRSDVTLLYSAHDIEHNNTVALRAYLEKQSELSQR